ncbi:MAG: hypothetical protein AcusKO_07450 [Acuticoccus sp.]
MSETRPPSPNRHRVVAVACVLFVGVMVGAAYAAVPFYNWFCRVTGFDGTPSIATVDALPGIEPREREVTVMFDANVAPGLPWRFKPLQRTVKVRVGELAEVRYVVENLSDEDTVGRSTYNVTPYQGGGYFTKIDCFCFSAQPLAAGETREMPVVFYVDPSFDDDENADGVSHLTLSYTFFSVESEATTTEPAG